jgi:hypothetical protein
MLIAALTSAGRIEAQGVSLVPGDLAVIGLNSDGPGTLVLLALTDLPSGAVVKITDHSWTGTDFTNAITYDGVLTWTMASPLPAGAVVTFTTTSLAPAAFSVSTGSVSASGWTTTQQGAWGGNFGDSVLIYQGAATSPTFLYAFTNRSDKLQRNSVSGFYTTTNPNKSALPTTLSSGLTALSRSGGNDHLDNLCYTGPRTGTRATLLAAIGNHSNWLGNGGLGSTPLSFASACGGYAFAVTRTLFLPIILR